MSEPVRLGFVGCGSVMQGAYVPLAEDLAREGLATLVTAFDVDADKAKAICEKTGMRAASGVEDVVGAEDVDYMEHARTIDERYLTPLFTLQEGDRDGAS